MQISRVALNLAFFGALLAQPSIAGTYAEVEEQLISGNDIPYAIVHPAGYDGSGGVLQIDICVLDSHPEHKLLVGPTQTAIDVWNGLEPTTGNCVKAQQEARGGAYVDGCRLVEYQLPTPLPVICLSGTEARPNAGR